MANRWCAAGLLLPLLGGCATVDHYAGLGRAFPPPGPTGAFDGSYYGEADLVRSRTPTSCPEDRLGVLEIGDKRASWAYQPQLTFNPTVQPDGSIHDKVGPATLDGQITGNDLAMTVRTPDCQTDYRLRFIDNHS